MLTYYQFYVTIELRSGESLSSEIICTVAEMQRGVLRMSSLVALVKCVSVRYPCGRVTTIRRISKGATHVQK